MAGLIQIPGLHIFKKTPSRLKNVKVPRQGPQACCHILRVAVARVDLMVSIGDVRQPRNDLGALGCLALVVGEVGVPLAIYALDGKLGTGAIHLAQSEPLLETQLEVMKDIGYRCTSR